MTSRDEREAAVRFAERYAIPTVPAATEVERRVIGAAWGANGYTTVEQAEELARRLQVGPDDTLLDVGTGRGWPGVYLATRTGCRVVGTDMPFGALVAASARARREGIAERTGFVAAAGTDQPFRSESFDAVVLTDVLC